jgi:hypothetical protein
MNNKARKLLISSKVRFVLLLCHFERLGDWEGMRLAEEFAGEIESYLTKTYLRKKRRLESKEEKRKT